MKKEKILIVDDEEAILKMYKTKLDQEGFETITASGAESGLELAKNEKPSLIFLDILMQNYNGLDALKKLKSDPATKNIPVCILTNIQKDGLVDEALKIGALDYFVKAEYEPEKLAQTVKELLKTK